MTLSDRVAKWRVRWHQRVAVRRWDDASEAPFAIEISGGAAGPDTSNSALVVELDFRTVEGTHHIGMRGAVKIDDEHFLAIVDAEIRASVDGVPPTEDELVDFAQGWGHDYLMGYLRVGLTDSAAQVGIQNVTLPPSYMTKPNREAAAGLVADARERAAAAEADESDSRA